MANATCGDCGHEMKPGTSCTRRTLLIGKPGQEKEFQRIPWGNEARDEILHRVNPVLKALGTPKGNCPDCSVRLGGLHHDNCDREECPSCGGQWLMDECGEKGWRTPAQRAENLRRFEKLAAAQA